MIPIHRNAAPCLGHCLIIALSLQINLRFGFSGLNLEPVEVLTKSLVKGIVFGCAVKQLIAEFLYFV